MDEPSRARDRVQAALGDLSGRWQQTTAREDAVGTAAQRTGQAVGAVRSGAGKVAQKVADSMNATASRLTLEEYRTELEAALAEAIEVITAQRAEIEALRTRLDRIAAS